MSVMTDSEFILELQESFSGTYSTNQKQRILNMIEPLNGEQIGTLFTHIEINYLKNVRPLFGHIYGFMRALGYITAKVPTRFAQLHPQSPYQMVLKYKDKPAEWLTETCRKIQKLPKEELTSQRVSFHYYWNYLLCIPEDFRNLMKGLIIEQNYQEIYSLLEDKGEKVPWEEAVNIKVLE